jgi:hypothetical protein
MKKFLAMDIGCHECGVGSVVVGVFDTEAEAEKSIEGMEGWRDGGQSLQEIFEIEVGS